MRSLLAVPLLSAAGPALAEDAYYRHAAASDPYAGLMRQDGGVDPMTIPGVAIYFSFDEKAHACVTQQRHLVCALIPGSSAQALPME